MRVICATILGLALCAGPVAARQQSSQEQLPSVELPPELQRVLSEYEVAWRARDAAALAELFAPDGFVMAPGRPPARGRAAIRDYYTGRGGPLSLRALAFATADTVGWIVGGYSAGPSGLPDGGKFTLTLRMGSDGRWLIVTDMDNGNQ
jgi:ketosteroid isomerase-like protein